jgi:acetoin utilization protein AcuB
VIVGMWMSREVVTVAPDTRASDAAALMASRRIRRIPVVEDGRLVGIVSKTELLRACPSAVNPFSAEARAGRFLEFPVGSVMTRSVVSVEADATIEDASRLMRDHQLGMLPVLRNRRLVGVLSQTDIARAFRQMVFAEGAKRITAEAPEDPALASKIVAACDRLDLEVRTLVLMEEQGKHLLVLSVRGGLSEPLLDYLWALGCRVLHVSR